MDIDKDTDTSAASAETASDSRSDLELVRAQFAEWRSRQVGRRHIPDALWAAAIDLLVHYPISVVSQHLRLNAARLQQQRDRLSPPLGTQPGVAPARSSRPKRKQNGGQRSGSQAALDFLPFAARRLAQPTALAQVGCSLIIERVDGSRLTVRLPANSHLVESLCATFLRQ